MCSVRCGASLTLLNVTAEALRAHFFWNLAQGACFIVRIRFDVGGVMRKYPDVFRKLLIAPTKG